jgi:hypothetical protein
MILELKILIFFKKKDFLQKKKRVGNIRFKNNTDNTPKQTRGSK